MEMELKFDQQDNSLYSSILTPPNYNQPLYYQPEMDNIASFIDPFFDRFLYSSPTSNTQNLFDKSCSGFYHLGITSGKFVGTRIWPIAYASRALTPTQPLLPKSCWGDTLVGGVYEAAGFYNFLNAQGSGGSQVNYMNIPEGFFKTEISNVSSTYQCTSCITNDYGTINDVYNHFTAGNYSVGDSYSDGVMWFNYSLISHPRNNFTFERKAKPFDAYKNQQSPSFEFIPIPCNNWLSLKNTSIDWISFKLVDVYGIVKLNTKYSSIINTSNLPNGLYTALISDSRENVIIKKVIVNHQE
jgi:hypothetical protein